MLRWVVFDTTMFADKDDAARTQKNVMWLLEALTQRDQEYLKQRPNTQRLYRSGVRYMTPQQFAGDVNEVAVLKTALGKTARQPAVKRALDTVQDVLGGERFRDIGRIIENGGGDCFPLSQKIIVRSKSTGMYELLSIGDLRFVYPHYEALSYNFSKCRYEFKDIVGFVDKGVKPVSVAHLSNGTDLVSTNDHKFWSVDGSGHNRRRVGVRTMGEYVDDYTAFKKGKQSANQWTARARIVQASKIPALDAVHVPEAQAYLAGMYAAEGEFSDGKHTRIGQHKPAIREKIEVALTSVGTSFHYAPGRGRTAGSGAQYSLHGGAANPIVAMMRGQGTSSFDKRVPQGLLSGSETIVARLLEGHADGDAWQPKNGSYKRPGVSAIYATSSDELAEQLRLGTLILGRPTYNYRYEDHGGEGDSPLWRLHEYDESASKLRTRANLVEHQLGLPGLRYGTVRSARAAGKAHVGCIEVADNHNFVLADGTLVSNCDNLSCWRAAELRQAGIKAAPYMTSRTRLDGGTTYHALVVWPSLRDLVRDGVLTEEAIRGRDDVDFQTTEDPSLLLGMGGDRRSYDRAEELRKNQERCDLLRASALAPSALRAPAVAVDALDDDVLGLRRGGRGAPSANAAIAELDALFRRAV